MPSTHPSFHVSAIVAPGRKHRRRNDGHDHANHATATKLLSQLPNTPSVARPLPLPLSLPCKSPATDKRHPSRLTLCWCEGDGEAAADPAALRSSPQLALD